MFMSVREICAALVCVRALDGWCFGGIPSYAILGSDYFQGRALFDMQMFEKGQIILGKLICEGSFINDTLGC